jgi:hypothetical protein
MASFTIGTGDTAKHDVTLSAATVDTVTFTDDLSLVRIINQDGAAKIYVTVDGSAPTVGGAKTYMLPAAISVLEIPLADADDLAVKLISAGTPTYSVERVR